MADGELHLDLDALSDFLVDDAGQPLTITVDRPLQPANARLMDFLGVRVTVVAPIAICLVGGCDWRWDGEGDRGAVIEQHRVDEHDYIPRHRFSVRTSLNGVDGYDELDQAVLETRDCATPRCDREANTGSDFCRVCDEGLRIAAERAGHETAVPEPKREVETVRTSQRKWTREAIIAAIRRWALENGVPPKNDQWVKSALGRPTASTVAKEFGSWSAAIEAAGFDRPLRGGNGSSVREPKAREAKGHSSPAVSSSPQLPGGDAAVPAVSPSPAPTEAEAGSSTDEHDEASWFARIGFDKARFQAERDECSRLCDLYEMRRDMLDKAIGAMEGLA